MDFKTRPEEQGDKLIPNTITNRVPVAQNKAGKQNIVAYRIKRQRYQTVRQEKQIANSKAKKPDVFMGRPRNQI